MALLPFVRRRWPETSLAVLLVLALVFAPGLAWRAAAIPLLGAVALFSARRRLRDVALGAGIAAVLLLFTLVLTVTIDLGQAFGGVVKHLAESQASHFLRRPMRMGRLSIHLATGRFIVEDIRIDGVHPADTPFFAARRIVVGSPWWRVIRTREFLIDSIEMADWQMQIEKFDWGTNLPNLKRTSKEPEGPRRFTTTLRYVHAWGGTFTYLDHNAWYTVARNLDIYVRHSNGQYVGTGTLSDGTVRIKDYLPMRADMRVKFTIENGGLTLPEIVLDSDGARSLVTGRVDFSRWPEMLYQVDSRVNLWRMREIFFARESWRSQGEARFIGRFHLFKGGYELAGDFTSALAHVNVFAFPDLKGSLVWRPHRFEVTDATSRFYSGQVRFHYLMAPLSDPRPAVARWDVTYRDVDLAQFSDAVNMRGVRLLGSATGRNLLQWPLGRFSEHTGGGQVTVVPAPGHTVMGREPSPWEDAVHAALPEAGPERDVNRYPVPTAVGGEFTYTYGPEWLDVAPSHVATERTFVEFQGRTAYGDRSQFPFHARSADWQESDRLMAGIITAFGSPTGIIRVGGHGEFRGTMTRAFKAPLIEGEFTGDDMRAWDVTWGHTVGRLSIENGYVDISRGRVTRGGSDIQIDGRFSLGYPRKDDGPEIDARFVVKDRDLRDLRHAFQLDDWPLDGLMSGEFRLADRYTRPVGYGRLAISRGVAWGEPLDLATAQLRFEGDGVRLDAVSIDKSGGRITGAAQVLWDGRYSFNANGQRIPMESLAAVKYGQAQWSGMLHFSANGASTFQHPRYEVTLGTDDLFVGDQGIGAVVIRLGVSERLLTIEQLEAAGLGVSGSGQIDMTANVDSDLSFRFTKTLLDPYVRLFEPQLSPFVRAMATGSIRIVGQLANPNRLSVHGTVDDLRVRLLDYDIRNPENTKICLAFDDNVIKVVAPPGVTLPPGTVPTVQLRGEGTRLDVSGAIDLRENRMAVKVDGDANLGILQFFSTEIRASGRAALNAAISGPVNKPRVSGDATIAAGRLRHFAFPQSLSAINGRVAFTDDGIRFERVSAEVAGGKVEFTGRAELNGYTLGRLSLSANATSMEFRSPEGFRSTIDAQLDLVGTLAAPTLRGNVTVKDAFYTRRFDVPPGLVDLTGGKGAAVSVPPVQVSALPLRFDVRVQTPPSALRVDNNMAHILASADVTLRGTSDRPLVFGRVEIERGELLFEGRRYVVRRGAIDFPNPTKIEPYFDMVCETFVRVPSQTYLVTVQVAGTLKKLNPQITSDPPMSEVEILALLFGGDTPTSDVRNTEQRTLKREEIQGSLAASRVQQAAIGQVSAPVTRAVEETFGLDTFQLTPNVYDPYQRVTNPTARLTVGKRISDKVYLTYSRSLNNPGGADQVMLLEYDQSDRFSWIFSRNEDNTYALDVRVRHVF